MRKIATKLTPKIKEYIWDVFNTRSYQEDPEEAFFHFPNYENHVGFLNGSHSDYDVQKDYEEVDGDTFIKEVNEYRQKGVKELENAGIIQENKPQQYLKRFPSGAVRSDSRGKLRVDFISPYALQLLAKHFTKNSDDFNGEEEFGVNYFKGIRPKDINPSLTRHWLDVQIALTEGNKEQIKEELTALGANIIMALHQIVLEEKGLYKEEFEGIDFIVK